MFGFVIQLLQQRERGVRYHSGCDGTMGTMQELYRPLPTSHNMPTRWPDVPTIVVQAVLPELAELLLARRNRARVMVLPRAAPPQLQDDPQGKPVYADHDIFAVEALRRAGVNIDALHDQDERRMSVEFSADVAIAMGLFIAQAISEQEIQNIYRHVKVRIARTRTLLTERGRDDVGVALVVDVFRIVRRHDEVKIEMRGVRGPAEQTAELLREALREAGTESGLQ